MLLPANHLECVFPRLGVVRQAVELLYVHPASGVDDVSSLLVSDYIFLFVGGVISVIVSLGHRVCQGATHSLWRYNSTPRWPS